MLTPIINPKNSDGIENKTSSLLTPSNKNKNKDKVTSVNGKTGDVYINAHDVGTYTGKEIDDKIGRIDPGENPIKTISVNGEDYYPNKRGKVELPDYPTEPTELSDLNDDETHRLVSDNDKDKWDNKSDFSGDYEDLENKPYIPTVEYATASDMLEINSILNK